MLRALCRAHSWIMTPTEVHQNEILVVGTGLAGLTVALHLAESGRRVTLLAKRAVTEGSSYYAQGGIAAAIGAADSFEYHMDDTLEAGAGLCDEKTVEFIVSNAPAGIDWLCVSPKGRAGLQQRTGDELKLVFPQVEDEAQPERFESLRFSHFFLQPLDDDNAQENTAKTVAYCLAHPKWSLSLQTHKIIGID